ncbi:hypothetical protein [Streptomyces sp. NPDC088360]|uniref:hypothetical protein n=1 Tax=Streptomyces sp. NPDC088360 TaxID=3154515 RepID=UPI00344C974F
MRQTTCTDPPRFSKKILGAGLSLYVAATALRQAQGTTTPFSVVKAQEFTATYWIAFVYVSIGVVLGVVSLVYSLASSSLRMMGVISAYLLAFSVVALLSSPATLGMQIANALAVFGVCVVAFSAWLRHVRERP